MRNKLLSTGVGMANTKERLLQAYGENHSFNAAPRVQGGFEVIIEMPFNTKAEELERIEMEQKNMVGV